MLILFIIVILIWEIFWTSKACWAAAKADEKAWFLFMLVFNLLGLPEIYYLNYRNKGDGNRLIEHDG